MIKRQLYLSFSARDAALATKVAKALEKLGFSAFNPMKDVRPGDDWRMTIHAAIKKSDALLLLVASPESAASSWMSYEAGMAEALGKRVLALVPDRYSMAQLPSDLAARQVLLLDILSPERSAREIADVLAAA